MTTRHEPVVHRAGRAAGAGERMADPITTEVVRHALNSAANQMKRALIRTAFSPVIYEVLDFAVAIYDAEVQLLAQAPSLPMFMGTLSFCVREAVNDIGGVENLEPGDALIYNWPYGTGSHAQDMVIIVPVFLDDTTLIGYTAIKGHWLDIGAKNPYCSDTTDVFQEGVFFRGVKIYRRGELNRDIFNMVRFNSRVPKSVVGDLDAQVTACRVGARGYIAVAQRFGLDRMRASIAEMFDHGERMVRSYFEKLPDGRYVGQGQMDKNGVTPGVVPFEIAVEISGSNVRLDFSNVPEQQAGPINSPIPTTISSSRIAISMLAGNGEAPHEGHFRAIEVVTRPGTMFHPLPPAPCFLYGWPGLQAIEVIYDAIGKALPHAVPASSGGCICGLTWWGTRAVTNEPWADGAPHPVGQGAWHDGDGGTMLHISESATRFTPVEVWESRNPWLFDKLALAQDSGGAGKHRGGCGIDFSYRMLEESRVTTVVERNLFPPKGMEGGRDARPNNCLREMPDGTVTEVPKETDVYLPEGSVLHLKTGGGAGYGDPAERPVEAVMRDLREGYISEGFARKHYPHAFVAVPAE